MQIFKCPFCGTRNETEFRYTGQVGKLRPEPANQIEEGEWAKYVHFTENVRGPSREIWTHMTCGEVFFMTRDSQTMRVLATEALRRDTQ
jgi:heterotetrameric sarcosine oxidase delta subunit